MFRDRGSLRRAISLAVLVCYLVSWGAHFCHHGLHAHDLFLHAQAALALSPGAGEVPATHFEKTDRQDQQSHSACCLLCSLTSHFHTLVRPQPPRFILPEALPVGDLYRFALPQPVYSLLVPPPWAALA